MAAGLIKPISYGADLEVLRHGATQWVEQATQTFTQSELLVRDASGNVGTCGAAFTRVDAISIKQGQNTAAAGFPCLALPVMPTYIFEATLVQAFHQNLCLAGTFYGLTRTAIPGGTLSDGVTQAYAWCVDTGNTAPHVEILGQAGPSDNSLAGGWADGDTYSRVLIKFNPAVTGYGLGAALASVANTLTAHSGGTQAAALALTASYNRLTTVAALGDSVRLPASAAGLAVTIDNQGAFPAQVFGAGTDTINGIATATGISQGVGIIATYYCTAAGNWEVSFSGSSRVKRVALTTNGAIDPHTAADYIITKAGVLADTLAAPTTVTDDGLRITIISNTTNAHTLTATGLFGSGAAATDLATFAAFLGAGLTLEARGAKWLVVSQNGITFS